jgi:hypothetical protein
MLPTIKLGKEATMRLIQSSAVCKQTLAGRKAIRSEQPRPVQVPDEDPDLDDDLALPLETGEHDELIPDEEERVIDVPS